MEQTAQPDTGVATSSAQIPYPFPTFQPATVVTGVSTVTGTMPGPTQLSSPFPTAPAPVSQLTYQQIQQQQQQQLEAFWASQMEEIEQTTEFKNNSLPLARIKKIMKADEDVRMISAEAPVIFAKACELFILELTLRSWINTEENKRRTLQKNDIAAAITRADVFDFLVDIVPRDELRDEGLGVPRADPIPYFFLPTEHQMAAGPGMVMGKHIDQTSVGAYGGQHHHLGAYMWQAPQGQSREQQQQMPDSG